MSHLNKKVLGTGAALVALSAFVPNLNVTDKLADMNLSLNPIGQAHAQATKTASLKFSATVANPLKISNSVAVKFGKFAIAGAGNIKLPATGAATPSNAVTITAPAAGKLTLGAPASASFSLSITKFAAASDIYLTNGGAGAGATASKSMTVTKVRIKGTANVTKSGVFSQGVPVVTGYKIGGGGTTGAAAVGATINFDGTEIPGVYTGTTVVRMSL